MNVHGILSWPEHHVGIAWWIAILLSSTIWFKWAWRGLRLLPIWGAEFRRDQLARRIQVLETLQGDTNRLVLYLARDFLGLVTDFISVSVTLAYIAYLAGRAFTVSSAVIYFALTFSIPTVGTVIRLRSLMHDLLYYDSALAYLKRKQARLTSKFIDGEALGAPDSA